MKKYFVGVAFLLFTHSTIIHAQTIDEVVATGERPASNGLGPLGLGWGIDIGAMSNKQIWEMQHAQSVESGRSIYERIKQCQSNADATGQKCKEAYHSLQPMCSAYTMYFGARLASKFWEKALGDTLDNTLKSAIALGAGSAGLNLEEAAINCTFLTQIAISYCTVGAQKMKSQCK